MTRKGIEKGLVVVLFVLVLIAFSFAERDSKKLDVLYTSAQLIKNGSTPLGEVTSSKSVR